MSIIYRVLIQCDRCDEETELHEDWRLPSDARWKHIAPPKGWRLNVGEHDAEYGHVCANCWREVKQGRA